MATTNTIAVSSDKASYAVGEKITLSFVGDVTKTFDVTLTGLTASFVLSDGTNVTTAIPATIIKDGQVSKLTAKFVGVADPNAARVWLASADGKTISAIA